MLLPASRFHTGCTLWLSSGWTLGHHPVSCIICPYRPPAKKREKRKPKERQQPTRASSRLKGEGAAEDEASELALFVINGDCPRCGKVLMPGSRWHSPGLLTRCL